MGPKTQNIKCHGPYWSPERDCFPQHSKRLIVGEEREERIGATISMAETATESSSGEDLSVSPASESKKKERNERQTLASMAEDLQRNVISSTDSAIRSARSLHHNSSAHFRNLQVSLIFHQFSSFQKFSGFS